MKIQAFKQFEIMDKVELTAEARELVWHLHPLVLRRSLLLFEMIDIFKE
ncbi:hypothetical protein [Streptococcus devriesei]|nr:hypothetical protein [Streptococcus devriesei]